MRDPDDSPLKVDFTAEIFIDCGKSFIPSEVVHDALLLAARIVPPCDRCSGACSCGRNHRDNLSVVSRYIRNWERRQYVEIRRKLWKPDSAPLEKVSALDMRVLRAVREDEENGRREKRGFTVDHEGRKDYQKWHRFFQPLTEAEVWRRRFEIAKSVKTKRN